MAVNSIACALAALVAGLVHLYLRDTQRKGPVPPGPKRYPIIGNLLNFPAARWAEKFSEWHQIYGDFIYVNVLNTPMFISGDREIVEDLMNKQGKIFSSRPPSVLNLELMGWDGWNIALMPPGPVVTEGRMLLRKGTSNEALTVCRPIFDAHKTYILKHALDFDGDPDPFISDVIGRLMVRLTYADALTTKEEDNIIAKNDEAVKLSTEAATKVYLVNFFPSLKYIPAWLPGAGFQRLATHVRTLTTYVRYIPWKKVLRDSDSGIRRQSLANKLVEQYGTTDAVRDMVAMIYAGGQSTTSAALNVVVYALLMHPEVQERAQKELDDIIGGRLPDMDDLDRLPYVQAIWQEALRWHAPIPLLIPHVSLQDHAYKGYVIPKDSMVFANVGYILRDKRTWGDPTAFQPERFLGERKEDQIDPRNVVFGYGRRICPGRDLANRMAAYFITLLLWGFDIVPVKGDAPLDRSNPHFIDSMVAAPAPFKCHFRARSDLIAQLIRSS